MATAKQKAWRNKFKNATKQAKREGKKGKAYTKRVGQILKGEGTGTSKKTTKKKTTRSTSKPKGGNKTTTKKSFTQGDLILYDAMAGSAVHFGLGAVDREDPKLFMDGVSVTYTGYHPGVKELRFPELIRGWGGTAHEFAIRKGSRMTGVNAYPSKKSFLEMLSFYGKGVINAWDHQGDLAGFYHQNYKDYHGIDLEQHGFDAWVPMEMADTRLPLWLVKQGKKFARSHGLKLPKGL